MKTDQNGCSTCPPGHEQSETFLNPQGELRWQYDYRTKTGKLFSCVAKSLDDARAKREAWLIKQREK